MTSPYVNEVGHSHDLVLPHLTPHKRSFGFFGPHNSYIKFIMMYPNKVIPNLRIDKAFQLKSKSTLR